MATDFKTFVLGIAEEKGIKLSSKDEYELKKIGEQLYGNLITAQEAVEIIKKNINDLYIHFKDDDFELIEKQFRYK